MMEDRSVGPADPRVWERIPAPIRGPQDQGTHADADHEAPRDVQEGEGRTAHREDAHHDAPQNAVDAHRMIHPLGRDSTRSTGRDRSTIGRRGPGRTSSEPPGRRWCGVRGPRAVPDHPRWPRGFRPGVRRSRVWVVLQAAQDGAFHADPQLGAAGAPAAFEQGCHGCAEGAELGVTEVAGVGEHVAFFFGGVVVQGGGERPPFDGEVVAAHPSRRAHNSSEITPARTISPEWSTKTL